MVGSDKMRISWITKAPDTPAIVKYGTSPGDYKFSSSGTINSYKYMWYQSDEIHEVVIGPLKPNTQYYYICGSEGQGPEYNLKTPPAQFPVNFVVTGDLGQTYWTKSTIEHIAKSTYDVLINPGDLSYADRIQPMWDSFGRLVEPQASRRPWMVTQGNHEVEKIPLVHSHPFTAYNTRWHMPYEESGSNSNLYYSFNVAGAHIIMLGSYVEFDEGSDQFKWLESDLSRIDRKRTQWVIVVVHAPWYNSNTDHQGESEADGMKAAMENLLFKARVDIVFAGHIHAYERFDRVYKEKLNKCGPVYINIGDGGNREGLATKYIEPQPNISKFREASFGHGQLLMVNGTQAQWTWHRNDDNEAITSDTIHLTALSSISSC
ncbi:probable purple acid phosphatase 20 [Impatiens glandulifera]|uniref:probable purple acid phosphatase 20 n=1 Tax=Impatiens glandulifera TaxID=253017 RepID=UPI001FB06EC1|nr:probable purple acid phosphatase 20 [Impatiens glandulifera]